MPTYSYRCTECATAFDIQQAFTDESLTVCPQIINGKPCGGKLRKLFHAVGVSFSGSGFYRNDSRAGETKAREKKESAAAESSGSGSGSGSKEPTTAPGAPATATTAKPDSASKPASKPAPATKSAPAKKE